MRWTTTMVENVHIPAAYGSAVHTFVIFCALQLITGRVTCVLEQRDCSVTILEWVGDIPWKKTSTSSVYRRFIFHILLSLLAVHLIIGCKYWPQLGNVTGRCPSWKFLEKICRTSRSFSVRPDGQWRTQYLSPLLSPDLFQDKIQTSGKHRHLGSLRVGVSFLLHNLVDALRVRNIYFSQSSQKRPHHYR